MGIRGFGNAKRELYHLVSLFSVWSSFAGAQACNNGTLARSSNQLISTAVRQGWTNSTDGVVNEGASFAFAQSSWLLMIPEIDISGATTPDAVITDGILQSLKGEPDNH